ncbi:MAG: acyltransferase [Bacteroidales bacterium]|nr:acyltransferase [Bacteroidales bacterium]
MNIPAEFDEIRPYQPEEMAAAFDRLLADPQFCGILQSLFKGVPLEALKAQFYTCKDTLDFQKKFIYAIVKDILAKYATACDMDAAALPDRSANYTFISNHRDIVLDAAFLDVLLLENGFSTTVEIAIGDNLLIQPWIETVVKLNKSFIVKRSVVLREMLQASRLMSRYMHFAVQEKHENLWIAQREGRAKDSDDRTQESVLKMLAMGGEGSPLESLKQLHLVPLAISYEFDPCDYLKAKEFQQKRDNPEFKKSKADDMLNMQTGIFGFKGRIHYEPAADANTWLDEYADQPKGQFFGAVAARIDREIHRRYRLYPNNYLAADWLDGTTRWADHYTAADSDRFAQYLAGQLAKIDLPGKDEPFLRERILTMYANPLKNQVKAQS